jgi:hypothetical protein
MLDVLAVFFAGEVQAARRDLVDARLASCIELTIGRPLAQVTATVVEPSGHEEDLSKESTDADGSALSCCGEFPQQDIGGDSRAHVSRGGRHAAGPHQIERQFRRGTDNRDSSETSDPPAKRPWC